MHNHMTMLINANYIPRKLSEVCVIEIGLELDH